MSKRATLLHTTMLSSTGLIMRFFRGDRFQQGDSLVLDPQNNDVIIAVLGATGSGKSTFINTLIGRDLAHVGHGLQSKTLQVQHYPFSHPQYPESRIFMVDTPGSNATRTSDAEILRRITTCLAQSYQSGMKLAGIIYLHDISHRRMEGSKRMNYEVFEKLCGEEGATKVVLATTMWSEVSEQIGETREKELKDNFWSDMFSRGSTIHRLRPTKESSLEIVESVLSQSFARGVAIQREMVDERRKFINTRAYNHLQRFKGATGGASQKSCIQRIRSYFR